jgi:hypothetical protein
MTYDDATRRLARHLRKDAAAVTTSAAASVSQEAQRGIDAALATAVPLTREITIDGVTYDLSANRTWTTSGGGSGLAIEEVDGSPTVVATKLILPNGTLSVSGTEATYTPAGGGGGGGGGATITNPPSAGWSWVNQLTSTETLFGAARRIVTANSAGPSLSLRVQAAPTPPYTLTAMVTPRGHLASTNGFGLFWRESSTGRLSGIYFQPVSAVPHLYASKWSSATSYNSTYGSSFAVSNTGFPLWLRLTDDGTNRIMSYSIDGGVSWWERHSVARTDFLTADELGWGVDGQGGGFAAQLNSWDVS